MELRNASLRSAAIAMSMIRGVLGFLFFEVLFWLREKPLRERCGSVW